MTPRNIQCTAILVVLVGYADYMNKPQLQERIFKSASEFWKHNMVYKPSGV